MRKCVSGLFVFYCFGLMLASAKAQQPADIEQGDKPFGSYYGSSMESVNVENGKLQLHVPFYSLPQRGRLKLSFSLMYSNIAYTVSETCGSKGSCVDHVVPELEPLGVRVAFDQGFYVKYTNSSQNNSAGVPTATNAYDVVAADKSTHNLGYSGNVYRSVDGSGFMYIPGSTWTAPPYEAGPNNYQAYPPGTIVDEVGTQYVLTPSSSDSSQGQLTQITDVDGNYVSIQNPGLLQTVTDTLNRTIPAPPTQASTTSISGCPTINASNQVLSGSATWDVPGYGGTKQYLFCFASVHISTGQDSTIGQIKTYQYHTNISMIQSIVLPDGTYWGFLYDAADPNDTTSVGYGDVVQLIYPVGGAVVYSWTFNPVDPSVCTLRTPLGPGPRAIHTRTVNSNVVSGLWTYEYGLINQSGTQDLMTTVTDPNGDQVAYTFADFASGQCSLYEVQKQYKEKQSTGSLAVIKTISTQYQSVRGYDSRGYAVAFPSQITTSWTSGQSNYSTFTYDGGVTDSWYVTNWTNGAEFQGPNTAQAPLGKIIGESDYDYSGNLLRKVQTTYLWQSNGSYLSANLLDTPSSVTTTGAGGNTAETDLGYDESSKVRLSPSQAISVQIGSPPGKLYGHQTTEVKVNGSSNSSMSTYWLNTGEIDHRVDARGNSTSFSYSSTYDGAYQTQVTNALNQSSAYTYDFNTGLETSATDLNSQTMSYGYDSMNRLALIQNPLSDGGKTTFAYNPSGYTSNSVLKTVLMCDGSPRCSGETSGQTESTLYLYDGLGRQIQSQVLSDPIGIVYVDTTYDSLGRVHSVSNPYRSIKDAVYGVTTHSYDSLGRETQVTYPDGGAKNWSYSGNIVDVFDEQAHHWRKTYDAAGRLIQVLEPDDNNNPVLETDYQYDALNNLTKVDQCGGPASSCQHLLRTFSYDNLSQLITAYNPEAGWICYGRWSGPGTACTSGYDANGNLLAKTDAGGVVTSYSYDAINRLLSKSYSDGSTPRVDFAYDAANSWAGTQTNLAGRLSVACTGDGPGCNGSSETKTAYSYDSVGRVIQKTSCSPANCSGTPNIQTFGYNLSGNLSSWSIPSSFSSLAFVASHDGSGHLRTIAPFQNNQQLPAIYTMQPWGVFGVTDATLGSNLNLHRDYDVQGRIYHEKDTGVVVAP